MHGEEAAEDIQGVAAQAGYGLTLSQLRRWHRAQIVGAPRQRGLGRARGTSTFYPAGTTERVLAICQIMKTHRSLRDVAWRLWWEGANVDDRIAREQLEDSARALRIDFEKFIDDAGPTAAAEDFLDQASDARLPSRPLRWARRRLGADNYDSFLDSLLSVAAGRADELNDADIEMLDRGLGFDSARTDLLISGEPWLTGDARSDFVAIGGLFGPDRVEKGLRIDNSELGLAREEAKDFLTVVSTTGKIVTAGFGRWGYGFGMIGAAMDEFADNLDGQRRFLLFWLSMRTPEFREGMQAIIGNVTKMKTAIDQLDIVRDLIAAVPAVGEAISIKDVVQSGFDLSKQTQLQKTVARVRQEHSEDIDQFFEQRGRIESLS